MPDKLDGQQRALWLHVQCGLLGHYRGFHKHAILYRSLHSMHDHFPDFDLHDAERLYRLRCNFMHCGHMQGWLQYLQCGAEPVLCSEHLHLRGWNIHAGHRVYSGHAV